MRWSALALACGALFGCNADGEPTAAASSLCQPTETRPHCPETPPSYQTEVIPILEAKCNSCHDGTQGLWPLTDYQSVIDWQAGIEEDLMSCSMPPAGAPELTPDETHTLLTWFACGAPRDAAPSATPTSVGTPCLPSQEALESFAGFQVSDVSLSQSPTCGDERCLVQHFQGRVSCPYGQTQTEIESLPADSAARCRLIDDRGTLTASALELAVAPQLTNRRASDVVVCSCQCAGPAPNADYCTCPAEMECVELIAGVAPGAGSSYCIAAGTRYDPLSPPAAACDKASADPSTHCGGGDGRENP
jgi:hypothetical protein